MDQDYERNLNYLNHGIYPYPNGLNISNDIYWLAFPVYWIYGFNNNIETNRGFNENNYNIFPNISFYNNNIKQNLNNSNNNNNGEHPNNPLNIINIIFIRIYLTLTIKLIIIMIIKNSH